MPSRARRLLPLVLATTATQASIVVLAPLVVEIGRDLGASVSAVGLARSVLSGTAVAVSLAVGPLIDRLGIRPLLGAGAAGAMAGALLSATAPSLALFYAAHLVTGAGVACLLSAGFAGVASSFQAGDVPWAMGYVVGAQSVAWIVGNPIIGMLAEAGSWRLSYVVPAAISLAALVGGLSAPSTPRVRGAEGTSGSVLDGLAAVFRDRSARRWTIAELVAYSAWTAELTYAGAFYIQTYAVEETAVGLLLAAGSVVFLTASLSTASLTRLLGRRSLVVACALGMGAMLVPVLNVTPSVWFTLGAFCLMGAFAGVRSAGSSALGLGQLPERPGSMMGARTASAQLGYMVGAAGGGLVLAVWDFGILGFVLFTGMAISAVLLARVSDPAAREACHPEALREPVPD
ncbi:MAG: MFS transporter [Actinomycetota bacterium]|nr:MFS transporter [Actinomycetota bacterium]